MMIGSAFVSPIPIQSNRHQTWLTTKTTTITNSKKQTPNMLLNFLFGKKQRSQEIDLKVQSEHYPAICVENITKTFSKKTKSESPDEKGKLKKIERTITAVDNLSFEVSRGKIFGLLGPNSSGKTTTLRCMSTLSVPDSGKILYYGIDIKKNAGLARNLIGYVAQNAGVDKVLTGREHLELFAGLSHLDNNTKKRNIDQVIEILQLEEFIDRQTGVYSGGVIRRLDLAIALLHQPPILILDEPTVGLDIETRLVMWDVLRGWRDEGGTIVLTSHYLEEIDVLSDEVGILDHGVLIAKDTTTGLKNSLGGDRVTIRIDEFTSNSKAQMACDLLKKKRLVTSAMVNRVKNNSIELVVDSKNGGIGSEVVTALSQAGHERLFSFSQSKPSLDDVYLAATGQSLIDADATAKQKRDEKSVRKESMA